MAIDRAPASQELRDQVAETRALNEQRRPSPAQRPAECQRHPGAFTGKAPDGSLHDSREETLEFITGR